MSDTKHHLTNDDLGRRITDVEQGLTTVLSEQVKQGIRLDALEQRWGWLVETLTRLIARQQDISDRTQLLLQRGERRDELLISVEREIRTVSHKVDGLACSQCVSAKSEG